MRKAILPISLGLGGLALTVWLFWGLFATQRADVAVARNFLTQVAAADYGAAQGLMTPALADRAGPVVLSGMFNRIEPWERIRFSSRRSHSSGGSYITDLVGRGITASGCESALAMTLIDGLVDAFNVTPLCPLSGEEV